MSDMEPLRILVTGSRPDELYDYDRDAYLPFRESLTNLLKDLTLDKSRLVTVIVSGKPGAEQIAFWSAERAKRDGFPIENHVITSPDDQTSLLNETGAFGRMEYEQMLRCATKASYVEYPFGLSTMLEESDVVFLFRRTARPNDAKARLAPVVNQAKRRGIVTLVFDVDQFGDGGTNDRLRGDIGK